MGNTDEIVCSSRFAKNMATLTPPDRRRVEAAISKLQEDPRRSGLNVHQMKVKEGVAECYVTHRMRLIYELPHRGEPLRLWDVGHHHIVETVNAHQFGDDTTFMPYAPVGATPATNEAPADSVSFAPDPAWLRPADEAEELPELNESPLALLPATHLRFYGVPAALVPAVQAAADVEAVVGLPDSVKLRLLELLTHPDLANILYEPDQLLYRTTLDCIEGFCEGRIKKLMLNLTPHQAQCVAHPQPGMVVLRGTAGSGKTTVGLYRAIERARAGRAVLLVTYTNSLVEALGSLVRELEGRIPSNLTILTVDKCLKQTAEGIFGQTLTNFDEKQLNDCLRRAIQQTPGAGDLNRRSSGRFIEEELKEVILARGLTSWEAYRDAPRTGRGSVLGKLQRRIIWDVGLAYTANRLRANINDWHTVALALRDHAGDLPDDACYDDIIIDETQDVTLAKLRAIARLLRHTDDATFWLLTDAAQTIYTSSVWWGDDDLGQSLHRLYLRRNHRNTRQIAEVAADLLTHNTLRPRDVSPIQPERTTRFGPPPVVVACADTEDQAQWVRAQIQDLCDGSDLRFSDCAVLCRTKDLGRHASAALDGARIPNTEHAEILENSVKVLTFHSAKGLEFPVVFVLGADRDVVPNAAALRGREDEAWLREMERERALLYVALTRAADMLWILTSDDKPSPFLAELGAGVRHEEAHVPLAD